MNDADQYFKMDGDFAGSHILVAYAGAMRAGAHVTRTKEEAYEKALTLIASLQEGDGDFGAMAQQESDGPSGPDGGNLGVWTKGAMVPEFDTAIEQLAIGDVTTEPVETAFGYHIIQRNDIKAMHYGARAFIVAHAGVQGVPETITRTKEEAAARAQELAVSCAETFEACANEHNDLSEGPIFMGAFTDGQRLPPEMWQVMPTLNYGDVAGPYEFSVGYAVIERVKLTQSAGSHILIGFAEAPRGDPSITRTREEADALASEIIAQLNADPSQFAALAQTHSDGPTKVNGGDLGVWFTGGMVPEFEAAMATLDIDEVTQEAVETPFGLHIIKRNVLPE